VGAYDAYEEALKLEPNNDQAKNGLAAVKRAIDAEARADGVKGDPLGGLGGMFSDPQMIQKLASNPKTSALLADPQFMQKLQRLKDNPNAIGEEMRDPRFLQVMSVLLGIDMQFGAPQRLESLRDLRTRTCRWRMPSPSLRRPRRSLSPSPNRRMRKQLQ
jgi:hypothetical protein